MRKRWGKVVPKFAPSMSTHGQGSERNHFFNVEIRETENGHASLLGHKHQVSPCITPTPPPCTVREDTALVFGPWVVDVLALGAVDLDRRRPRDVGLPHGEAGLAGAVHPRAPPKVNILALLQLAHPGDDTWQGVSESMDWESDRVWACVVLPEHASCQKAPTGPHLGTHPSAASCINHHSPWPRVSGTLKP